MQVFRGDISKCGWRHLETHAFSILGDSIGPMCTKNWIIRRFLGRRKGTIMCDTPCFMLMAVITALLQL